MEISCTRCHQPVLAENCYCPYCGLPQLVYEAEGAASQSSPDAPGEVVQDAGTLAWKPALRAALMLAVPAGLLSSGVSPLSPFGVVWAAAGAACAVTLYVRHQRAAWITIGAGARIGLVTGLMAAWLAFGVSGGVLLVVLFACFAVFQWRREYARAEKLVRSGASAHHPILADEHFTMQQRMTALPRVLPFLLLLSGVMVALYGGIATPSETAGLGAVLAASRVMVDAHYLSDVVAGLALVTGGFFGTHALASAWTTARAPTARGQASALYLLFYYLGPGFIGAFAGRLWASHGWPGVTLGLGAILLAPLAILTLSPLRRLSRG